jgi:predicted transcriptional regulator
MPPWLHTSLMSKEVFVTRIPPSMDRRIDRAAHLHFDDRSEIVRRAANIGLALIRDKNWECADHLTFEDRTVRLAVRVDPALLRRLTILADQHWTTRAGVLRAALHYGLWKLGAPLGREHYASYTERSAIST